MRWPDRVDSQGRREYVSPSYRGQRAPKRQAPRKRRLTPAARRLSAEQRAVQQAELRDAELRASLHELQANGIGWRAGKMRGP